jgi:hypothetical protein
MADRPISVAETDLFVRQADDVWDAVERHAFVDFIARNPEVGDIIPDTGGVRKLRWRKAGTGKRGGVRVVYFFYDPDSPIYLLMVYAKARREDMTPDEKRAAKKLAETLKSVAQAKRQKGVRR